MVGMGGPDYRVAAEAWAHAEWTYSLGSVTGKEALGGKSGLTAALLIQPGVQAHPTLLSVQPLPSASPSGPTSLCSEAHYSVSQCLICEMG